MNTEINLCEILKGHEGETFYSPVCGYIKFNHVIKHNNNLSFEDINNELDVYIFLPNGKYYTNGEICIFPSKDQRDWNKWDKENNKKTPKTWSELREKLNNFCLGCTASKSEAVDGTEKGTSIEKAALAIIKIHKLIEFCYGGNVTNEEWINDNYKYIITYYPNEKDFHVHAKMHNKHLIAFHTIGQTEEFLSYPENIQLLKDYYMIN